MDGNPQQKRLRYSKGNDILSFYHSLINLFFISTGLIETLGTLIFPLSTFTWMNDGPFKFKKTLNVFFKPFRESTNSLFWKPHADAITPSLVTKLAVSCPPVDS